MAELKQVMEVAAIVLPLIAFLALATAFAVILRRAGRLLAATRDVERNIIRRLWAARTPSR